MRVPTLSDVIARLTAEPSPPASPPDPHPWTVPRDVRRGETRRAPGPPAHERLERLHHDAPDCRERAAHPRADRLDRVPPDDLATGRDRPHVAHAGDLRPGGHHPAGADGQA